MQNARLFWPDASWHPDHLNLLSTLPLPCSSKHAGNPAVKGNSQRVTLSTSGRLKERSHSISLDAVRMLRSRTPATKCTLHTTSPQLCASPTYRALAESVCSVSTSTNWVKHRLHKQGMAQGQKRNAHKAAAQV